MTQTINFNNTRLCSVVLFSTLFVASCSGSNSGESESLMDSGTLSDAAVGDEASIIDQNLVDTSSTANELNTSTNSTVPVTFDIAVPVYVSDALQVRLQWADTDVNASWVTDESWTVSSELPANTESELVVSFNDGNGALTLGRFESSFKTGSGDAQSFSVAANQFNTARFDSDADGVSNLDELLAGTNPSGVEPAQAVQPSFELVPTKIVRLTWPASDGADYFRVLVNRDGISGYEQVGDDIDASVHSFDHRASLFKLVNASYIVQACNAAACVDSDELQVAGTLAKAIGYFKASNADRHDTFGSDVSLSADGRTLAVGAKHEDGGTTGINGDQTSNTNGSVGAVYVFVLLDGIWEQQAYVKPSNYNNSMLFGGAVKLSADGNTLVVGARTENGGASGVNSEATGRIYESGAAYVFVRNNGVWEQEAYLKAPSPLRLDTFGNSVGISGDGNTIAIGSVGERGISPDFNDESSRTYSYLAGAVYMYERSDGVWQHSAFLKASNAQSGDRFGQTLSMSADGNTLAVGAPAEESSATGINGDQADNSLSDYYSYGPGAVYLFRRSGSNWNQQAYIKASNGDAGDQFGNTALGLSSNGNVLAVGAHDEASAAVGINGNQDDNSAEDAGAAYVFEFSNGNWAQVAYLKASNAEAGDRFGGGIGISDDGKTLAVGAAVEHSAARGINDRQDSETDYGAGAVYVFSNQSGTWQQLAYVKASNTDQLDGFGWRVSVSGDGNTLAVGAMQDESNATGVNGDAFDNSLHDVGSVYLY